MTQNTPLCSYCGTNPMQRASVFCEPCSQPGAKPDQLPTHRYLAALIRLRDQIQADSELHADPGDDYPGNRSPKDCNWGLCSRSAVQRSDAEDHIWRRSFLTRGRVAPLPLQNGHRCPLDTRLGETASQTGNGCFHSCRVFQRQLETPDRETTLRYYAQAIELAHTFEGAVPAVSLPLTTPHFYPCP